MRVFQTRLPGGNIIWNWTVAPTEQGLVVLTHRLELAAADLQRRFGARPDHNVNRELKKVIIQRYPGVCRRSTFAQESRGAKNIVDSSLVRRAVFDGMADEDLTKYAEYCELKKEHFFLRRVLEGKEQLDGITMSPMRKGAERRQIPGTGDWTCL